MFKYFGVKVSFFAFIIISVLFPASCISQKEVIPAAERTDIYFPYIGNKPFGIVANHTSMIGKTHIVDSLTALPVNLVRIFSPEHGFRGTADAGASIEDGIDVRTGKPVISLYGNHKKPTPKDLEGIEIMIFDIQDVGVRFYTYISTLTLVMEACAEQNIPLVVLDRPNPNGFYVDGPVLDYGFESFVGMHRIPVVHGMTIAEYARMVNGEGWLKNGIRCDLIWVKNLNYDHGTKYELPVDPSPNLRDMDAIYLYPSLCFFEGTQISVGRGTEYPFTLYGHPGLHGNFSFIPQSGRGAKNPKLKGQECFGRNLKNEATRVFSHPKLNLSWLISVYNDYPEKDKFFNNYFDKLAGTDHLRQQIIEGKTEDEIRESWNKTLSEFKNMRKKYLLYADYE